MSTGDGNRRKILGALDEVMRAQDRLKLRMGMTNAASEVLRQLQQGDNHIDRLIENAARNQSLIRAALGPLEDIRRMERISGMTEMVTATERARTMVEEYEKRFSLPEISVTQRLLKEMEASGTWAATNPLQRETDSLRKAMEAMTTPWLDVHNKIQSLAGFAELQIIGLSLESFPAFDDRVTTTLRSALGDWRDRITWPAAIFIDPLARSDFYKSLGFDPRLTDFPVDAFRQSLTIAGLGGAAPDALEHRARNRNRKGIPKESEI